MDADPEPHPAGVALLVGGEAWVLAERAPARSLGAALAWALRRGATSLHVVAGGATGLLARRAERLAFPIHVWSAEDRTLLPAGPEPLSPPPAAAPDHLTLAPLIEAAGATVTVEHGVVSGEVRGLEVCRVVDQPTTGSFAELSDALVSPTAVDPDALAERLARRDASGVVLEVGVGANDREAFQLLHGDRPTVEALRGVVGTVAAHRSVDAPRHPLNRLAPERFLRWRIERDPGSIGLRSLVPDEPPVPRPNLRDPVPCVAVGADPDGERVTVVCSAGVDVDLVPYVADVQHRHAGRLLVVLPARDRVPITRDLSELLHDPVELVTVG